MDKKAKQEIREMFEDFGLPMGEMEDICDSLDRIFHQQNIRYTNRTKERRAIEQRLRDEEREKQHLRLIEDLGTYGQ